MENHRTGMRSNKNATHFSGMCVCTTVYRARMCVCVEFLEPPLASVSPATSVTPDTLDTLDTQNRRRYQ